MTATDPTFYRSPGAAVAAAPEQLAYVAAFDPVGQEAMRSPWSTATRTPRRTAASSAGPSCRRRATSCTTSAGTHARAHCATTGTAAITPDHGAARASLPARPGIRSSNTYVLDTKPDPRQPVLTHTIEASELAAKAGYSRPHTVHCGPGGIFMSALGGANGDDGPGGVALIDHDTFEVIGQWELDRGAQFFAYDVWWHLNVRHGADVGVGADHGDREGARPRRPARPQVRTPRELLEHVRAEADPARRSR